MIHAGRAVEGARRGLLALLSRADAAMNRLYGHRLNPLYHSGVLVVFLLVILLVTGTYLLFFYRIGDPYGSVGRISDQVWLGSWIRALHRYASDAAVVAVAVHALRLFAQGRSWGPRALAWVSGLILLFVLFVSGWTGYVMIWDLQAQLLAIEGARWLDALPIFSEPIGRAFVGEGALPPAFFFLNLFAHIALPIGMFILLWLHVSRVARPALAPPRGLAWGVLGLLVAISIAWPAPLDPEADLLRIPEGATLDLFYSFWLPFTRAIPAGAIWAGGLAVTAVLLFAPKWTRPASEVSPAPSSADARLCTGCEQCYVDCPYEAIAMVERHDGRETLLAVVDGGLCVSCGICAGSCAPMGVGPPGLTGRDQLARVERFNATGPAVGRDVVLVACRHSAVGSAEMFDGARVFPTPCAGNLHSSVVEYLVRAGAPGVLVASCPPRDCWSREGPKWLEARLYEDREAELKARVDRRRVRVEHASAGEGRRLRAALRAFRDDLAGLESPGAEREIVLDEECEREPFRSEAVT